MWLGQTLSQPPPAMAATINDINKLIALLFFGLVDVLNCHWAMASKHWEFTVVLSLCFCEHGQITVNMIEYITEYI